MQVAYRWHAGGPGGTWLRTGGGCRCRGQGLGGACLDRVRDCRYRTGGGTRGTLSGMELILIVIRASSRSCERLTRTAVPSQHAV